jgi:hypothetical protein
MKKILKKLVAVACCAITMMLLLISSFTLASCDKLEDELDGMNEARAYYSYRSASSDFDYQDACGPFDTAIRFSVGLDPVMGGADDKVKEACDACHESLKTKLRGRKGNVIISKTRHPDGKHKLFLIYKF